MYIERAGTSKRMRESKHDIFRVIFIINCDTEHPKVFSVSTIAGFASSLNDKDAKQTATRAADAPLN